MLSAVHFSPLGKGNKVLHVTILGETLSSLTPGDAMEENGALKVNQFLQVEGNEETIFAIGDCTNIKENKLAFHANEQAAVLSKTIKSVLKGGKPYPYKEGNWILYHARWGHCIKIPLISPIDKCVYPMGQLFVIVDPHRDYKIE